MKPRNTLLMPKTDADFEKSALKIFEFQYRNNPIYRRFCDLLNLEKTTIDRLEKIPFLPIQFFKSHKILSSTQKIEQIFTSSGTTSITTAKHFVTNLFLYEESFMTAFEQFYGKIEDYLILALLPSYLERKGSSLVYMAEAFIKKSKYPESGFFLNNFSALAKRLQTAEEEGKKTLLLGVSFALLDFVQSFKFQLKNTIVMETGGMKGRRKEPTRSELHQELCKGFGVDKIHSEYGMTELLSQAYSQGNGIFECPYQMKILIRDPEDPFKIQPDGKTGGLNIIDLANVNSCAFIATQDLGKKTGKNSFEIQGRFDNSDLRGCNLMALTV